MSAARILFVECYPQSFYGQQQILLGLLERCGDARIDSMVATPMAGAFVDALRTRGLAVEIVPQPDNLARYGGELYREGWRRRARSLRQTVAYVRALRRWLRERRFDALFCNDMRGLLTFGLAARTAGIPVLIWDKLDKPHGALDWLQLPLATRNLVISDAVCVKYPAWQRRLFRHRIRRVFDGVAITAEPPRGGAPGPERREVVVAIVGSVTPRKGHDLLLEAFRRARSAVPDLRLWVIGDALADADRAYRDRLAVAVDGISWLGFRDDVPELMHRIDILASPSRHEGMGRVNVEAMAAGKPVVGSVHTGIAEVVVDGETGFLVDPNDVETFAERLVRLARDPELRRRLGEAGRERAEKEFEQDTQLRKVLDELRAIAGVA
jgi:glycosyltransferase involved in cell wall biosynthesis